MKNLIFWSFGLVLIASCSSQPSLKSDLLDSSSLEPVTSGVQEMRLGNIRYGKQRLSEREAFSWYFTADDTFQRGVPRDDQAYESIKVKVFEVGEAEKGKYSGFALERWDVTDDSMQGGKPVTRRYHHYFFRSPNRLVHLPAMTKGAEARPLWQKGKRGQEILSYLGGRWNVSMGEDKAATVPELQWNKRVAVPGEGMFQATSTGESLAEVETRSGLVSPLTSLPKGKEVYRVPGDWIVCVFPDGLAFQLKKE